MRISNIKLISLLIGVVVCLSLFAVPASAETAASEPGTITDWMKSLPEATRTQVEGIFIEGSKYRDESAPGTVEGSWKDNTYFELQAVCTPEQFNRFMDIVKRKPGVRKAERLRSSPCDSCEDAWDYLDSTLDNLEDALNAYDDSYCDYSPYGIDKVYVFLGLARYNTELALDKAEDAMGSCSCSDAEDADDYRDTAAGHLTTAISNTSIYCDANSPWKVHMSAASTNISLANFYLGKCKREACN